MYLLAHNRPWDPRPNVVRAPETQLAQSPMEIGFRTQTRRFNRSDESSLAGGGEVMIYTFDARLYAARFPVIRADVRWSTIASTPRSAHSETGQSLLETNLSARQ
jgi:hypothetical protein